MGCKKDLIYFPGTVNQEVEKALDSGYDGIIVCVHKPQETSLYSAGWKDRKKLIQANPNSLFKIASISKLYMASAASMMIADQTLNPDATLSQLIPELADKIEHADEITVRMMIKHRSGIPDYVYDPEFPERDKYESYLETASLVFNKSAEFKPNRKYKYSNTNYLLLGEIMDRAIGYSYWEYIKEKILKPLQLENTFNTIMEVDSNEVMSGYYVNYEPDLKYIDHTRPGGSMIATAEDVARFLRALIDGSLLNDEEQEIYTSLYPYEHTGWVPGYTSIARYHDDIDAVIVQFVNTSKGQMFWLELERVYSRIVRAAKKEN